MSGKRHHYLPQFLLSGFSHRSTGKDSYCWVYRKGRDCHESNLKNVGVEGYFYGKSDTTELDQRITNEEDSFAETVRKLRQLRSSEVNNDPEIPRLVVHLSIRTRHLRKSFTSATDILISEIIGAISGPGKFKQLMLNSIAKRPEILREAMLEELEKRDLRKQLTPEQEKQFLDFVQAVAPAFIEKSPERHHADLMCGLELAKESIPEAMKSGHIRALESSTSPEQRIEHLSNLAWEVLVFPKHSIILGDVGAWAFKIDGGNPSALSWAGKSIDTVVLPISHSHALVGTSSGNPISLESRRLNSISASLSLDYFVSSRATDNHQQLSVIIGKDAMTSLEESVKEATDKMNSEWFG